MRLLAPIALSLVLITACAAPPAPEPVTTPEPTAEPAPSASAETTPTPEEERAATIAELEEQWPGAEEFIAHAKANDWDRHTRKVHRRIDFWFDGDLLAVGCGPDQHGRGRGLQRARVA